MRPEPWPDPSRSSSPLSSPDPLYESRQPVLLRAGLYAARMPLADGLALFVYGSLKRGFRHHDLLLDARFRGEVETAAGYHLVLLGEYPALAEGGDESVMGELYAVEKELLGRLDRFEGPDYERREVRLAAGGMAHAYFARMPTIDLLRIPGRTWDRK